MFFPSSSLRSLGEIFTFCFSLSISTIIFSSSSYTTKLKLCVPSCWLKRDFIEFIFSFLISSNLSWIDNFFANVLTTSCNNLKFVYWILGSPLTPVSLFSHPSTILVLMWRKLFKVRKCLYPVSYTHLTLPTIYSV